MFGNRGKTRAGPHFVMAGTSPDKPSHDQVETATSAPVTLGARNPLIRRYFLGGISFCSNGAGRRQNLTQGSIGIKSYNHRRHSAPIIETAGTSHDEWLNIIETSF